MTIMRLTASPTVVFNTRDGKEAKLKDLIARDIQTRKDTPNAAAPSRFTVIARAPDSVVAQALISSAAGIAAAGIEVSAILFESETTFEETPQALSLLEIPGVICRVLRDQRFAAAHEQLVLNEGCVWIGDCMRRDPTKRDAFEMFHDGNKVAEQHATASFNRLWAHAKPVERAQATATAAHDLVIAGQPDQPINAPAATRR